MSAWSAHRRIAGAVIAGLALTLAPAVAMSASAAPAPGDPAPPTALQIDRTVTPVQGEIAITWTKSVDTDVSEYLVASTDEDNITAFHYVPAGGPPKFVIKFVQPGESIDVSVSSLREGEQFSDGANLRVTGLDDGPNYNFTDTTNNTFKYEISWLSSAGITTGYVNPNGSRFFSPSQPVLREQVAAFLYRLDGSPAVELPATSPFTDVPTNARFYKEIVWLAQQGISTGYVEAGGTKTFRPAQPVLREQFAAFLFRYDNPEFSPEGRTFTDVPQSAVFYRQIEWLSAAGISTGYVEAGGTKTFRGNQPVLREQTAAFLYRYVTGPFGQNGNIE